MGASQGKETSCHAQGGRGRCWRGRRVLGEVQGRCAERLWLERAQTVSSEQQQLLQKVVGGGTQQRDVAVGGNSHTQPLGCRQDLIGSKRP